MLMDFHIHTKTSSDCKMSAKDVYEAAAAKGIKNICITNHHEPSEVLKGDMQQSMTDEDLENYKKNIAELRNDLRVSIMMGVEMSYTANEEEYIREYLAANDFDFVLGSVHYVRGWQVADIRQKDKISAKEAKKIQDEYFVILSKAIKSKLFDVMSHIDHYKRLTGEMPFEPVEDRWKEIGRLLVGNDVGFEINTSWSKLKEGGTYPEPRILKVLLDAGVKKITLGSDAHRPEEVGREIEKAQEMLRSLGVKEVYRFEKRKPIPMKL